MPQRKPRRIVVAGAGHAAMLALDSLGAPPPGTEIVLVSRGSRTHYSGMVPGWIEGLYPLEAMTIPIQPFAAARGVTAIPADIVGADETQVHLADGSTLAYDTLVVNVGSETSRAGALAHASVIPAKPFDTLVAALAPRLDTAASFAVAGAGVAGTEIALALATRRPDAAVALLDRADRLLPALPSAAVRRIVRALEARSVRLVLGAEVAFADDGLTLADGRHISAETVIAATGPAPPPWLAATPFRRTPDGFLAVDAAMRSLSHPAVLGVGDVATRPDDPRPKAGVFSVRSAAPLAAAIRRIGAGEPPEPVTLQRRALVLLATGGRSAIGTRNGLTVEGRWVWRLKDRLDRGFVDGLKRNC